jgi:hypothetical protein
MFTMDPDDGIPGKKPPAPSAVSPQAMTLPTKTRDQAASRAWTPTCGPMTTKAKTQFKRRYAEVKGRT